MASTIVALAVSVVACSSPTGVEQDDFIRVAPSVVNLPGIGSATQLTASVPTAAIEGNPHFEWIAANPNVASVDQTGRVEARGFGSTLVIAQLNHRADTARVHVGTSGNNPSRAFPEARGFGTAALTRCDRSNVQVLRVTTTAAEGPGSLAEALSKASSNRLTIITFDTGGTIERSFRIDKSCVYIAGQTAPGDGVQVFNPGGVALSVARSGPEDVVVRYLRLRSGKVEAGTSDVVDIFGGNNIVLDHLSAQFGSDEVMSISQGSAADAGPIHNVTVQFSIIAAGLAPHSTGMLITSPESKPSGFTERITLFGNLWANNSHRNPRVAGAEAVQIVNNVVYNWKGNVGGLQRGPTVDIVGNYFKAGPWSSGREDRIFNQDTTGALATVFLSNNVADPWQIDPTADQKGFVKYRFGGGPIDSESYRSNPQSGQLPEAVGPFQAYDLVLAQAGASAGVNCAGELYPRRDRLDRLLIEQVRAGSGPADASENDELDDYGGVPFLDAGVPCRDSDADGMPDEFESRYGLDPAANDASGDLDADGFTNIEEYVNGTPAS